jgi:hypothetical protein
MSDNDNTGDNPKPPVLLDEHRGMTAQKQTDARRQLIDVEADQETLRRNQNALETVLFAAPAETWQQAAEKARYLLSLFAAAAEAQDPRHKQMIEAVTEDFRKLTLATAKPVS